MNECSVHHLVLVFEETCQKLSDAIRYSSPFLPLPFITNDSLYSNNFCHTVVVLEGRRIPCEIIVEFYHLNSQECTDYMTTTSADVESIHFQSGNPTVETTEGIIHVYKNENSLQMNNSNVSSTMLCIFSVPVQITVKDLLRFVSPMRNAIEELKVVKSGGSKHYMVLLKFRSQPETKQFYETFNNTCYSNLESEVCQLMYVSHVEKTHPSVGTAFPAKELLELPSCPVCLERLDEPVQSMLTTILCNHTFHGDCIAKVEDATCPVCRYVQSPELINDSQCAECCIRDNLWICLICGRIGCGRYGQKHAYSHFEETGHTFALELGKNLVWDYADDAYVHRLAVNQEDGKLVQLGAGGETGDKKLDDLSLEFGAVLSSQLESQRFYFEEQIERLTLESSKRIQVTEIRLDELMTELNRLRCQLQEVTKEKAIYSRKLQTATSLAQHLQKELEDERSMNKSLAHNEAVWRNRAEQAEEECKELLLNFELRDKLSGIAESEQISSEDLQDSSISLQTKPGTSRRRKKH